MNQGQIIEQIIESLERIQQRPGSFLSAEWGSIGNFLVGFYTGLLIVGVADDHSIRAEVVREHNLNPESAYGPEMQLLGEGLNEEEMTQEILDIEIETWRRVLEGLVRLN